MKSKFVNQLVDELEKSLADEIDIGGLYARSPVAHKWKAPFRALALRELVFWRFVDLLKQVQFLANGGHYLGERILLRSAYETLFVLIYLNNMIQKVCLGKLAFREFSDRTTKLILGSKDGSTNHSAINILTVLKHCETEYPGIKANYEFLSEIAHPNANGMQLGYSEIDHNELIVSFRKQWKRSSSLQFEDSIVLCVEIFMQEYQERFVKWMPKLEKWLEENDELVTEEMR